MIISNLRLDFDGTHAKLSATIKWEDAAREGGQYYFSFPGKFADRLGSPADAFLVAALVPSLRNGERRILVEGTVCPVLVENLSEALFWLRAWNPEKYSERDLVFDGERRVKATRGSEESALFFSGGVDASFALAYNQRNYPVGHAARATYALTVLGFDIGGNREKWESSNARQSFDRAFRSINECCKARGLEAVPVETNVRHLDDTPGFWGEEFVAAALSSVAHAFGGASSRFYVASAGEPLTKSGDAAHFGTHPILDPCYSGHTVQIRHYALPVDSRIKRLEALSLDPTLFDRLRVCYHSPPDRLNCEKCEKCVRTKLMLDVLGLLERCGAFSAPITAESLASLRITSDSVAQMYIDLVGRARLVRYRHTQAIEEALAHYRKYRAWRDESNWKGSIKRWCRRSFGGRVPRLLSP